MRDGLPTLEVGFNPSGAAEAGGRGRAVIIVDVVDASTTAEAAMQAGALTVLGAGPEKISLPLRLDPRAVGRKAGELAARNRTKVVLVAEPRVASEEERAATCSSVIQGVLAGGAEIEGILPNLGMETVRLSPLRGRVVVIISNSGGLAFDTACAAGAPAVGWATVARTIGFPGWFSAKAGAERAVAAARSAHANLSIIAASSNSPEDVLAAQEIARLVIEMGFLAPAAFASLTRAE